MYIVVLIVEEEEEYTIYKNIYKIIPNFIYKIIYFDESILFQTLCSQK